MLLLAELRRLGAGWARRPDRCCACWQPPRLGGAAFPQAVCEEEEAEPPDTSDPPPPLHPSCHSQEDYKKGRVPVRGRRQGQRQSRRGRQQTVPSSRAQARAAEALGGSRRRGQQQLLPAFGGGLAQ